jgi:transcriptional regulator with XRE-family HTH domain
VDKPNAPESDSQESVPRSPAEDADSISFQLQRARLELDMSVVELSRQTGISKTVLHGYERGRTKPGAREIRLLSAALKVSPNRLILGSEDFVSDKPDLTEMLRKMRARPGLATSFSIILSPFLPVIFDDDELLSFMHLATLMIRARNPESGDQIIDALEHVIRALNSITVADGAVTVNLEEFIAEQQKQLGDALAKLTNEQKKQLSDRVNELKD